MGYQKPLVLVYQEYAKLSVATQTTSLLPCVIGPCYHIIDIEDDPELSYLGAMTPSGVEASDIPNNAPGAIVEESSVSVVIKDPVALLTATNLVSNSLFRNELGFNTTVENPCDDLPSFVQVGDIIDIWEADNGDAPVLTGARVISVDTVGNLILLNKIGTTTSLNLGVNIYREIDDISMVYSDTSVELSGDIISILSVTSDIGGITASITDGSVHVGYRSLRQDLSDIGTVYNTDEILGTLGKMVPENPLAYGVMMTLANTTTGVKYIGVDSDNVLGYTAAKDRLENEDDVYGMVALSQNTAITSIFKVHAEQMSTPEKGKRRVAIVSTPLATTKTVASGADCQIQNDLSSSPTLIVDSTASFLSDSVDSGHTFAISSVDGLTTQEYVVESVISEDMLSLTMPVDVSTFDDTTEVYPYVIKKDLDKTKQAENIADVSKSFGYSRCVHIWPGSIIQTGVELPGYYLGCAVAGMIGGLPSHKGFTRLSIAGIEQLKYANNYFNGDQLDIIAEGGTFIFLQDNPAAAPYVRHQLTTDMSAIEFQELSYVKNFDYVSKLCQETLDRYLGQYNICDSTLAALETALRAVLESLKLASLPKIGAPIRNYDITTVKQLEDTRTRVEMYAEVDFPYPLNTIALHLISR